MFHRWAALVLVLALCAMTPKNAAGQTQSQSPRGHSAKGSLGSNYPNPFNPDTNLPFTVGDSASCPQGSEQHVVTMELVNVLGQHVVYPRLSTGQGGVTKGPIRNLTLPCGKFLGYWDGLLESGRHAPSGVYGEIVTVDGFVIGMRRIYYKK